MNQTIKYAGVITILLVTLTCIWLSGYHAGRCDERAATRIDEDCTVAVRDANAYIEDCTLADAHAQRCTIPCSTDTDCVEKNGTRDAY